MRIIYFTDSLRCGGKERQLVELLKGLKQRKSIELLLVCMDRGEFYEPDVQALEVPITYLLRKTRWDPSVLHGFYRIVKEFGPDIIHTNCMMTSAYALPVAKLLRVPIINGSIRNCFRNNTLRWKIERLLLSLSDFRVANSTAGLSSRGFSPLSRNNAVIHNGFDISRAQLTKDGNGILPAEVNGGAQHYVGMVAQFRPDKDFETYILAALDVIRQRRNVVFVAVGDGPTLTDMRELAASAGDRVRFLGKQRDVENIVRCLSVGVLATFTEGISNSIMEYMMMGKPVVVTDCEGSREIVVNGETGFLVPAQDPIALASRIAYLLDNPAQAKKMGDAGKRSIEEHFSLEAMIDKTVQMYERAAGRSKDRPVPGTALRSHLNDAY